MKFILTSELGRLAKWLRILGFDAVYISESNFSSLLIQALRENRITLTRNSRLVDKLKATRVIRIDSDEVREQLKQVLEDLNIRPEPETMFTRCLICNIELNEIDKEQVKNKVPEYVFKTQDEFLTCSFCQRIYWSGTHWGNVTKTLREINKCVSF